MSGELGEGTLEKRLRNRVIFIYLFYFCLTYEIGRQVNKELDGGEVLEEEELRSGVWFNIWRRESFPVWDLGDGAMLSS